jgi:hypothetical protein
MYETRQEKFNRLAVFFRFILVIPAFFLAYLLFLGYYASLFITWIIMLILGRMPEPLFDASANIQRYFARMYSYFFLLTPTYPAGLFNDGPGTAGYEAETEANPSEPQPPRQTPAAKRLIVIYLVVGSAALATIFAVGAFTGAKQVHNLNELRRAHNAAVEEVRPASSCAGELACLKGVSRDDANAFREFQAKLDRIHFAAAVGDEKAKLAATTQALVRAFDALANARSGQQFNDLNDNLNTNALLTQWDEDYDALDSAVKGY